MTTPEPLDLTLSEEEITQAIGFAAQDIHWGSARAVAEAATAKAAWGIVEWLQPHPSRYVSYTDTRDSMPPDDAYADFTLQNILEAAGIPKPE